MAIELPDARQLPDEVLQVLRLRALRGCEMGFSQSDVADMLGVAPETVCRWWSAYQAHGLDGLLPAQKGIEASPMRANRRPLGFPPIRPPDAEGFAVEVDVVPDSKCPHPLLQNRIGHVIGPQVRTAVDSPEKRAVGNRQPPEQRHLELFGPPSPFGMAITQRGRGGNPSGRLACLRLFDPLIALDDAHVMGVHDREVARHEFAMPEIVVFKDGEMRAADVRDIGKGLRDVSRRAQARLVRPMNEAPVAQVVQDGTRALAIAVIQDDRPPVRAGLGKQAFKRAPQQPGTIEGRDSHFDERRRQFHGPTDSTSATRSSARSAWIAIDARPLMIAVRNG